MPLQRSFRSIPAMMQGISGLTTTEGNTARRRKSPDRTRNMPLPLSTKSAATRGAGGGPRRPALPPLLPLPLLHGGGRGLVQHLLKLLLKRVQHLLLPLLLLLLLRLLLLLLLHSPLPPVQLRLTSLQRLLEEVLEGAVVMHHVRHQHHRERRSPSSHVTDSGCSHLRLKIQQDSWPRPPGVEASVPAGRRASRAPLPLSTPPPAARCGGGPSPAPWQPSYGRDGAMPGAGDPAASWRLQRVRHATTCRPLRLS